MTGAIDGRVFVDARPVFGRVIEGRECLTTEASCPTCGAANAYRHMETHVSVGRWYGCEHLKAFYCAEDGSIDRLEFSAASLEPETSN